MDLHERFQCPELRDAIFGYEPEYGDKYELAIFLRRIVLLSASLIRVYYKKKKTKVENETSLMIERIVNRPFISIDNSISILTTVQSSEKELDVIGLSKLKILSDEKHSDYINLYELKAILQDETGKFYDAISCRNILNKVVSCIPFISKAEINNDGNNVWFEFGGESFDLDLFKYEYCYLYSSLEDVDPLKTCYIPL